MKLKIAELSGALATVQIAFAEAQSEAVKKDAEIEKLRASFKDKSELFEFEGFFYRKGADGKPKGDPYCPRCLQEGKLMVTVHKWSTPSGRSQGRSRFSPISRVTPIALRSPNRRLIQIGDDHVSFRWKDYREDGSSQNSKPCGWRPASSCGCSAGCSARRVPSHPPLRPVR